MAAPGAVRQVTLPPAARALSTLSHVDYEDAFLVETGPAQDRTGEQWARASGRLGLSGELLFERQQHTLLFATFVQLDNPIARALWAGIAPRHRQVVRDLLEQASSPERPPCQP